MSFQQIFKSVLLIFFAGLYAAGCAKVLGQELPRADRQNSFYILPLHETLRLPGRYSYEEQEQHFLDMREELGEGNLYHRLGFSFIFDLSNKLVVRDICKIAYENGMNVGLIFALQSHTRNDYRKVAGTDLRLFQWRMDGIDWKGSYTSSGQLEVPEDERDYKIPTPSRYAKKLREYNHNKASEWAQYVNQLMTEFPGVVACVNGPIEEELAIGGVVSDSKLADYSPYAITEFRDWLRHSGIYDATGGEYAGEGASPYIIGDLIDFNGSLRSQFYDDPTPFESQGTGLSFNEFFGTDFKSWSLKYWDLRICPEPITDEGFDCSPESGPGFNAGGFDAPRSRNSKNKFWRAWSWDIPDQNGTYPPGNPDAPAFGFRQTMVRNFTRDLFDVLASVGIPRDMMYAHQIPGEALGSFTGEAGRNRSSASTVWTGYLEKSQTVGITRFGDISTSLMTQYADDWGIFEWHTQPFALPQSQSFYTVSINALNKYYNAKCHHLFPGWWNLEKTEVYTIFPLNDSKFAEAIHDFMMAREEIPYHQQIPAADFIPPRVNGLNAKISDDMALNAGWSSKIWSDLPADWTQWSQLSHYEIQWGKSINSFDFSDTTTQNSYAVPVADSSIFVRVRAHSLSGKTGDWSQVNEAMVNTSIPSLKLVAEYDSLYADPAITNTLYIYPEGFGNGFNPDSLKISVSGNGTILSTQPVEINSVEKFWPMDSELEAGGAHHIINLDVSGGVLRGTVAGDDPIDPYFFLAGSNVDTEQLPCISFRLYSSLSNNAQIYWFNNDGFDANVFQLDEGWNIIRLDSLQNWMSFNSVNRVRLDPGTTRGADIMLDWVAISSRPLSGEVESSFSIREDHISVATSTFPTSGSYTLTAEYDSLSASIEIVTELKNKVPKVHWIQPESDGMKEAGSLIALEASASDPDGKVEKLNFRNGDSTLVSFSGKPYTFNFITEDTGTFVLTAEAIDNAGDTAVSDPIVLTVFQQIPYFTEANSIPGIIEAENYDLGGGLIAYFDREESNQGGSYRDDAVDIGFIPGTEDLYYVGWTEDGEWMEYTISSQYAMKTSLSLSAASLEGEGEYHFELNDIPISNRIFVGQTEEEFDFQNFGTKDIFIPAGNHKLKVSIDKGGFAIDKIIISEYDITGINPFESYLPAVVFPNPAVDELNILTPGQSIQRVDFYAITGERVKSIKTSSGENYGIQIGELTQGVYFLHITTGEMRRYYVKFIKQ